jgi:hypothetical protein|tara:strand:+ start:456 stop:791 length:336 start_codon:yes stop_codon:yes gene_type:complete
MANLYTKTKLYLEANSKTWDAEKDNIVLQNDGDGSGDYIHTWNVSGLAKPNDDKIAEYDSVGDTAETLNGVLNKRSREYPSIADQLDKIYHDGVDEWKKVIKAVKDANPKG